jgi:hypothetical protein
MYQVGKAFTGNRFTFKGNDKGFAAVSVDVRRRVSEPVNERIVL